MIVVILFVLIKICVSAPIDTCSLAGATINDETWVPFVKKIVHCLEHSIATRDEDRYDFLISLATELSEVSFKNMEKNVNDYILPLAIPKGMHKQMKEILNRHINKGNELVINEKYFVSVVKMSGFCLRTSQFDGYSLVLISGILVLTVVLILAEIYISWNKYNREKRVRKIVKSPRVYTLRQSSNNKGDGIDKKINRNIQALNTKTLILQ